MIRQYSVASVAAKVHLIMRYQESGTNLFLQTQVHRILRYQESGTNLFSQTHK